MRIWVKLFPTLHDYTPAETARGERFSLEMSGAGGEPVRIRDVVARLGIPADKVGLAIVNGLIVRDFERVVAEGDSLFLSTVVGGG